jgi:acyl-coenzyme A synthetase/AMP-(fatty) acid ligase
MWLIDQCKISHMHIVPTMFVRLLRLPQEVRQRYDVSSLRFVSHGAAPCAPAVKRQMIEWWGPVINEYYGATETGVVVWHGSEGAAQAGHGGSCRSRRHPAHRRRAGKGREAGRGRRDLRARTASV